MTHQTPLCSMRWQMAALLSMLSLHNPMMLVWELPARPVLLLLLLPVLICHTAAVRKAAVAASGTAGTAVMSTVTLITAPAAAVAAAQLGHAPSHHASWV